MKVTVVPTHSHPWDFPSYNYEAIMVNLMEWLMEPGRSMSTVRAELPPDAKPGNCDYWIKLVLESPEERWEITERNFIAAAATLVDTIYFGPQKRW